LVKEIIVLREGGILLFHYSVSGTRKLDELVAAFLSAVGSFAREVSQDKITVMSFATNKLVWEKKGDLFFIALVSEDDSREIHRVILKELAEQFVSIYYADLMKDLPDSRRFRPFTDVVEATLHKFDGIPGLARRYKTILLPMDDLNRLKKVLAEVEVNRDIHRGSFSTHDGYVACSNLRAYELELVLDLIPSFHGEFDIKEHASLERGTAFLMINVRTKGIATFVVNLGLSEKTYLELVNPFIALALLTSFDDARKFEPDKTEGPISFYDFDGVEPAVSTEKIQSEINLMFSSAPENTRAGALKLVERLSDHATVTEIHEAMNLPRQQADELLAQLIAKSMIRIARIFPILDERDERFAAFLEVIGVKKKDFDVINRIWKYCNGSFSIREVSERTNIPAARIMEVLRTLGNNVTWSNNRVLSHVR
jgi:hypothetical protein